MHPGSQSCGVFFLQIVGPRWVAWVKTRVVQLAQVVRLAACQACPAVPYTPREKKHLGALRGLMLMVRQLGIPSWDQVASSEESFGEFNKFSSGRVPLK